MSDEPTQNVQAAGIPTNPVRPSDQTLDAVRRLLDTEDPIDAQNRPVNDGPRQARSGPAPDHTTEPPAARRRRKRITLTPRRLAVTILLLVAVLRPWLIPSLALIALVMLVLLCIALGPERIETLVSRWHAGIARQDPVRAERLRKIAAWVSARLSRLLARLPESWTRGLYLPDFEPGEAQAKVPETDPFDRLRP